jgi:oxygen-independent coproporphyrinogen III oxidase
MPPELPPPIAPRALYVHIPFCATRCAYCDFNTYAGMADWQQAYVTALAAELHHLGQSEAAPALRTMYIGGGTPTVLPSPLLKRLMSACRESFSLSPDIEITCEANPGSSDRELFALLRDQGINRISLGVQSLDDRELAWLGRRHRAADAEAAFIAARRAGFSNVNLDLIFGLPGQAMTTWAETLDRTIALDPEHISLYSLTVEEGTPLAGRVQRGEDAPPDDDWAADLYTTAQETLLRHGYLQYEISNWARDQSAASGTPAGTPAGDATEKPGDRWAGALPSHQNPTRACRHNLVYWRAEGYWGAGAGAHSYVGGSRRWNEPSIPGYVRRIRENAVAEEGREEIGVSLLRGELMMLGLRLVREGVSDERFMARTGTTLNGAFGPQLSQLGALGLIERLPDRVRLTPAGVLLGDRAFAAFLP